MSSEIDQLLRESLQEVDRLRKSLSKYSEPIAITSLACRTPGGVETPEAYWALLAQGRDAVGPLPSRWDSQASPLPLEGGFLENVEDFDPLFFGISPREALAMDPQQRLVLEVTWEALERAGQAPSKLSGSNCGVYVGSQGSHYGWWNNSEESAGYRVTGLAGSVLAGRVAYVLNFHGPAVTIDTACSSSLVAIHLACGSLREGECDVALAGGVYVLTAPGAVIEFDRLDGLSSDGRCKAFSAAADGTGWAEGVGMLVLKRLSDAQKQGDRILAVIPGSAINQDGRSQGLTAPNGTLQRRVIRKALAQSRLQPQDIDAIEAHGTGTKLGDPIEAGALAEVFGADHKIWLGSSKSNFGHAQSAAGILGVIKMVLALTHECLPRTLHATKLNPHVDWEQNGLCVLQSSQPWPPSAQQVRRAGVSAFGLSGTNAHVILEEPKPAKEEADRPTTPTALPIVLSGKTQEALVANVQKLAHALEHNPNAPALQDLAFSLATTRSAFPMRLSLEATQRDQRSGYRELLQRLDDFVETWSPPFGAQLTPPEHQTGPLVVLFTGQGSQYPGMGDDIYNQPGFEVFSHAFDEALEACQLSRQELAQRINQTSIAQPALFILGTALYRQWKAWGIQPDLLLGHSVGELIAAHLSGVLSLKDAANLVCARGRLMEEFANSKGAMASLEAGVEEVEKAIAKLPKKLRPTVEIAGINASTETVISGDEKSVERLVKQFRKKKRRTQRLKVSHAFHSAHMDAMLEPFQEIAKQLNYRSELNTPVISTLSGRLANLEKGELVTSDYWVRQVRESVWFSQAVETALELGANTFLECGPRPVLCGLVAKNVDQEVGLLPSLGRDEGEISSIVGALGGLQVRGYELDWRAYFQDLGAARIDLPTYAFQRDRYWLDFDLSQPVTPIGQALHHPLLSTVTELPEQAYLFSGQVSLQQHPWVAEHVIHDTILVPGTAILEICLKVARRVGAEAVKELLMLKPITLSPESPSRQLQLYTNITDDHRRHLQLRSKLQTEDSWTLHATAILVDHSLVAAPVEQTLWPPRGASQIPFDAQSHLQRLEGTGFQFGPMFRGLQAAWKDDAQDDTVWVELALPAGSNTGDFAIHPALLDALFQSSLLLPGQLGAFVPFELSDLRVWKTPDLELHGRFQRLEGDEKSFTATATLWDLSGQLVAHLGKLRFQIATPEKVLDAAPRRLSHTRLLVWQSSPLTGKLPLEQIVWRDLANTNFKRRDVALDLRGLQLAPEVLNARLLAHLQEFLSQPKSESLTVLTQGAILDGEDVSGAAAWGLIRSLRTERPELLVRLLDIDDHPKSEKTLGKGIPLNEPPEMILREGVWRRLEQLETQIEKTGKTRSLGTVLISGGCGGLGRALAEHLVVHHQVKHLLLLSRSAPQSQGAEQFVEQLKALGASSVRLVSCDVSNREALCAVLEDIPSATPLNAVFHLAGLLRDATFSNQTEEGLREVFAAKLTGALHLDEVTRPLDSVSYFVLFSSWAADTGSAGQASYAAANAGLDAVVARRHKLGLPATSIAWGPWEQAGMAASLPSLGQARLRRSGLLPLPLAEGLGILDKLLRQDQPRIAVLQVGEGASAARTTPRRPAPQRAHRSGREQPAVLLALIRSEAAKVLALPSSERVPSDRPLQELGIDSLTAVELRNRLMAQLQRKLPATLIFDYPSPQELTRYLLESEPKRETVRPQPEDAAGTGSVAIVGIGCRTPGRVSDPEAYWELLAEGRDAVEGFPKRWDSFAPSESQQARGGFLEDVDQFDPLFFGISPREAVSMDPQQRLVLEVVWEALERAGIRPSELHESKTGVYIGSTGSGYGLDSPLELDGYRLTGIDSSLISGRVSYVLGLQGPALTVNTACSSSLVALHLACRSIISGECDMAIAGGVQIMASPVGFVEAQRLGVLAPDGRCKAFAAEADGTTWGEGVGVVVLKRPAAARRDSNPLLALVKGSAINQDGRSQGLTAPNGPSQQRVLRQALAISDLEPHDIDAVEAHGTGTRLGDPIEAEALVNVFAANGPSHPLWLGSCKSNLCHTQSAAGVLGVIKMVLALHHGVLPRTLHAENPTPHVDWNSSRLKLLSKSQPWPQKNERVRRAGVSSFGISGTNAHLILEEPQPWASSISEPLPPFPLLVSARDETALRQQARRWSEWMLQADSRDWSAVIRTAALHRSHFKARAALRVTNPKEAAESLAALAQGTAHPGLVESQDHTSGKLVFVFSGQATHWADMGRSLLQESVVFTEAVEACQIALSPHIDWSVREALIGEIPLDRVDRVQPVLFVIRVALAAVWRSLGIKPAAVVGHSQGEIAAAVVAGALSLEDGARVVALRSALISRIDGAGGMAIVSLPSREVETRLKEWPSLCVAAFNSANSTVVSGNSDRLQTWVDHALAEGIECRMMEVNYASHSAQMDPILEDLEKQLQTIEPRTGTVPMISTVTGTSLEGSEVTASYWCRNLREPVRLDLALETLKSTGYDVFVEISPHPALGRYLAKAGVWVSTLSRSRADLREFYFGLGRLHSEGYPVDWNQLAEGCHGPLASLPTYAFQRHRYWLPTPLTSPSDPSPLWQAVANNDTDGLASLLNIRPEHREQLREILPYLKDWHEKQSANVPGFQYQVVWKPISTATASEVGTCWLIAQPSPWANQIAKDLQARRLSRSDFFANSKKLPKGLTLLYLVTEKASWSQCLSEVLDVAQLIAGPLFSGRLWFLTQQCQVITNDESPTSPGLQALWGFARALGLEKPSKFGGLIDLPSATETVTSLGAILDPNEPSEEEVALRKGRLYARRLTRTTDRSTEQWSPSGPILITGGTGHLGLQLAHWLAEKGADDIVLVSRQGATTPGAAEDIQKLRDRNCQVRTFSCDVVQAESLDSLLGQLGELQHIFHLAGAVSAQPLEELTSEAIVAACAAKIEGSWNLHCSLETHQIRPKTFLLFGSISGVWGAGGQTAYSASNAALLGLAQQRRAKGLPATVIHWGPWPVATASPHTGFLKRRGILTLDPKAAFCALGSTLAENPESATLVDLDWRPFTLSLTSGRHRPLIADIPEAQAVLKMDGREPPTPKLPTQFIQVAPEDRYAWLLQIVSQEIAQVLGLPAAEAVPSDIAIQELGLDSLMAVEVRNRLMAQTGLGLSTTLAFDHPQPGAMTEYLLDRLNREPVIPARPTELNAGPPSPMLVEMSKGNRPPLFLCVGAWGGLVGFREFARLLPPQQALIGLSFEGLPLEERTSLKQAAAGWAREIRRQYPNGPYNLLGFSFGGMVVHEMAHVLGDEVSHLIILDSYGPDLTMEKGSKVSNAISKLSTYRKVALRASPRQLSKIISNRLRRGNDPPPQSAESVLAARYQAEGAGRGRSYEAPLHLLRFTYQPPWMADPLMGWGKVAADIRVHTVVGTHGAMALQEPVIGQIADIVASILNTPTDLA